MSEANSMDCRVGRLAPMCCGIIHDRGEPFVIDKEGCLLADGHDGPHEFADQDGRRWQWGTNLECECEHCMRCEGDYCTTYWKKPPNTPDEPPAGSASITELG